jgi:outer membrane protein assembly factor BamB/chitodextrinase
MIKLGGGEMYKKFVLLVSVSFLLLSVVPGMKLVERKGVSANVGDCGQQVLSGSGKDGSVDWWPMFRHDLRHTGYSTSIAPNTNNTLWSYATGGDVSSSPTVVDGRVYVGSWDSKVYALNATNGTLIWSYTTGSAVASSPAVFDGRLYIGSYDRKVYALNATTGTLIWSYTTGGVVYSSPVLANGTVYVGSDDRKIYALNATNGALIWRYVTGDFVSSSPAVADGKVFVGSWDSNVYCLNATDGMLVWNYTTGDIVPCSPGVANGKVYIGSYDSRVYALDATNGMLVWSYRTDDIVPSSPAVVDGRVYVGSCDNKVYAFSTHDIAITNVTPSATVVHIGEVVHVTVVLKNEGTETETFNVTTCYNDTSIETQTVINLAPYTETTLIFNWATTNVSLGNYIISAKAEAVSGETDIADNTYIDGTIKIIKRPVAVFTYSPAIPLTKEAVTFNASLSTPDGGTLISYEWDFGDLTNATGVITTHSYDDNGTYTVTLTITDDEGLSDTDSQDVTVLNRPPAVSFTESASTVFTSDVIYFNASESYDLDGAIVTYFWGFGDGTNATGVTVDHVYEYNGTYTVTLTATDDDGVSTSTSADKTVLNRPDIAVINVASFKAVVGQGYSLKINVNVTNEGDFAETFNVTVYANTRVAVRQIVTLSSRNFTTITFAWDTSGFARGNYTIWAYVWPLQGETDTEDNTFPDGSILVTIPGDINGDKHVNYLDGILLGAAFSSAPKDANWNANADIDCNSVVNYLDGIILGANFGL